VSVVYLSPHLDDAVLSCGGAIRRRVAQGEAVQVITLITEDVARDTPLSPFARKLHRDWGGHSRPFGLRRAEDLAALTFLGARALHLDYLDAIYRTGADGNWMYTDGGLLFGQVRADDPLAGEGGERLAAALAELLPSAVSPGTLEGICAPLGVGRHVDHQIVHAAARVLLSWGYPVAFYEDYPYAGKAGATGSTLEADGAQCWPMEARPLDAGDLEAKVTALGYYRSQLSILFGGGEAMIGQVWAFAATRAPEVGLAERVWWPAAPSEAIATGTQGD
jgi:LmbE family N-acetylglucosaminyl deacetylase